MQRVYFGFMLNDGQGSGHNESIWEMLTKNGIADKIAMCDKINECDKIKMVLGHEMLDFQYAEIIRRVCERCNLANQLRGA